jgi:hypothetical protein
MNCAELENVLCDYIDGTLGEAGRAAVASHASECPSCAEMVREVEGVTAFLARVEAPEPPPELMTRILFHAPVSGEPQPAVAGALPSKRPWFQTWLSPLLQPRLAMGMAMTILSFSMVSRILGIQERPITMADLEPARVWASVDDRLNRGWNRAVKYYENLRLVFEIRARLQEWSAEEEIERKAQAGGAIEPASKTPASGSNAEGKSSEQGSPGQPGTGQQGAGKTRDRGSKE